MALEAVQHVKRMRGGAQSHLMLCSDGYLWIVKFQNNPQHTRVLANEMMATRLAAEIRLTVPQTAVVEVPHALIAGTPELEISLGATTVKCTSGLNCGIRHMGGLMPGQVVDFLPEEQLREIRNLEEFAGILALDKWTGNSDGRQAVFVRSAREKRYTASFIDQGFCFNAGAWKFQDLPLRGSYPREVVYERVRGWESFEPWLTRIETLDEAAIFRCAMEVPPEWYGDKFEELDSLLRSLVERRREIRRLIDEFRRTDRNPFPNWIGKI